MTSTNLRHHRRSLLGLGLVLALVLAAPTAARADDTKASCDIVEISATKADKASIPAELKRIEKKLKKPPFSSWNVFTVLSRASKDIVQLKAETITLTKGKATVLFRDLEQKGKKVRVALTVTTEDEHGKRIADTKVSIDSGDYIVIGRTLANDEGHLLALTCKP